jgi:hypothetical protein
LEDLDDMADPVEGTVLSGGDSVVVLTGQ